MDTQKKDKNKEFFMVPHLLIDNGTWANWSFKAKVVFIVICRYAGYSSRKAWPGIDTIAEKAGITADSAVEANKEICKSGWMSKKRGGRDIKFANIYEVFKQPN